uniref:Helicase-associated domain-containing protein n=1 Tax=Ditylum brightwellii TaxID=49249 RepID=A0A7S1ZYT4_9STRA|mmetsp:Transcript_4920/g.7553  ORF Transcript_4920/g.7553 Transcript_4920/m.7553 type:complete len:120 (+) Transcript_4920:148-507(+)
MYLFVLFELLKHIKPKYKERHGHCLVPRSSSNKRLARWVSRQRQQYWEMKEGKSSIMTAERVDMLNSLGFVWRLHQNYWHEMLDEIKGIQREAWRLSRFPKICSKPTTFRLVQIAKTGI